MWPCTPAWPAAMDRAATPGQPTGGTAPGSDAAAPACRARSARRLAPELHRPVALAPASTGPPPPRARLRRPRRWPEAGASATRVISSSLLIYERGPPEVNRVGLRHVQTI